MTTEGGREGQPEQVDRRRLFLGIGWTLLVLVLCLFPPAGTWAWLREWLFLAVFIASGVVVTAYLRRVNPEVIAARVNRHGGTKRWDRILLALFLPAVTAIPVVAALDDGRFRWSPVPWWACLMGYAFLLTGMAGLTWAESVNRFFEPTVRIQSERGHTVIDTGPYAIVRHPGYVAGCLWFLGIALCLGSFWALIPVGVACLLLGVRTRREDRMLQAELAGYKGTRCGSASSGFRGSGSANPDGRVGDTSKHCREPVVSTSCSGRGGTWTCIWCSTVSPGRRPKTRSAP